MHQYGHIRRSAGPQSKTPGEKMIRSIPRIRFKAHAIPIPARMKICKPIVESSHTFNCRVVRLERHGENCSAHCEFLSCHGSWYLGDRVTPNKDLATCDEGLHLTVCAFYYYCRSSISLRDLFDFISSLSFVFTPTHSLQNSRIQITSNAEQR